ncbi:MAG: exo-alpha-sialidase [Verrucomicrobia bacterium]|nr:exo-alpha-sialidase [Verrucomicrobiota bacterium]
MSIPARLLLVLVAGLLCWGVIRNVSPLKTGGFVTEQAVRINEKPFFEKQLINPEQGLPMVHVASLAQMSEGIRAVVWYGGTAECQPDVKIYFSQQEPSAAWTAPRVIMTRERAEQDLRRPVKALGNALLLANTDGSLRLLFVTIAMGKWSGSQLNSCLSKDGGLTWSRAERLTLSPFFNFSELVRNRAIAQQGSGWCVPIYQEFLGKFPELLWLGERHGRLTYRKTRITGGCSTFQPSLIPVSEEYAEVLLRDYTSARKIHFSSSYDGGRDWPFVTATELPNPDAGISGLQLSDGRLLVAFNDSAKDRSNLTLAIASKDRTTWRRIVALENEPDANFSYPFLIRSSDGMIRMAYTRRGKAIALTSFNEAWIRKQEATSITP